MATSKKSEVARRRQRACERIECPVHEYQRHGKEADELRRGLEKILEGIPEHGDDLDGDDARSVVTASHHEIRALLDEVDARDSLAYLERPRR